MIFFRVFPAENSSKPSQNPSKPTQNLSKPDLAGEREGGKGAGRAREDEREAAPENCKIKVQDSCPVSLKTAKLGVQDTYPVSLFVLSQSSNICISIPNSQASQSSKISNVKSGSSTLCISIPNAQASQSLKISNLKS